MTTREMDELADRIVSRVLAVLRREVAATSSPSSTRRTSIYALCDPDTLAVRYVGRSVDPAARFAVHMVAERAAVFPSRKERWLRELRAVGKEPLLKILESGVPREREREVELAWCQRMIASGALLTNTARP